MLLVRVTCLIGRKCKKEILKMKPSIVENVPTLCERNKVFYAIKTPPTPMYVNIQENAKNNNIKNN